MISVFRTNRLSFLVAVIIISTILTSCRPSPLKPLPQAEVVALADSCREIYTEQIDAWIAADYDRMKELYAEDVVHFDGGPAFVGVEEVVSMARWMTMALSGYTMDAGETYVSGADCLGTWLFWGGAQGFAEEDPRREFDIIEARDGQISFWRLFYGEKFDFSPIDRELLTQVAEVWSAKNMPGLEDIYAEDAVLEDSLMGMEAVGLDDIKAYAKALKKGFSLGSWELLIPFSESENPVPDFQPASGGVYQISSGRDSCPVQAVLILSPNQEGKIAHQMTLYQADSLIACGWLTE
jgi:ketosteroid isomerase-like protein